MVHYSNAQRKWACPRWLFKWSFGILWCFCLGVFKSKFIIFWAASPTRLTWTWKVSSSITLFRRPYSYLRFVNYRYLMWQLARNSASNNIFMNKSVADTTVSSWAHSQVICTVWCPFGVWWKLTFSHNAYRSYPKEICSYQGNLCTDNFSIESCFKDSASLESCPQLQEKQTFSYCWPKKDSSFGSSVTIPTFSHSLRSLQRESWNND